MEQDILLVVEQTTLDDVATPRSLDTFKELAK